MQPLLLESAVRATLIAATIALVLNVMRIKTASARHAVWASVVVVMMLLPAWLAWGPKASLPVLPPAPMQTAVALPVMDAPIAAPVATNSASTEPQPSAWTWATFVLGIYLLGLVVLLIRLAIGTIRANRLTSASCVVPVTVGLLRPRVILPKCSPEWPQAQLDAVLTHEGEHARRRDPLFQWLALLNRAIFWFHPLAWWLERRISGLAEEVCDAAVLARGHDPRDYSEYLLDLARSVERAGARVEVVGMAMPGAFLSQRIRRMLSGIRAPQISRPRMVCTAAVCAIAVAIIAAGMLVQAQSKASSPAFEVASVKRSGPNAADNAGKKDGKQGGGGPSVIQIDHGRFSYMSTLFGLIVRAYHVRACIVPGFRVANCALISGGPAWLKKDSFEIQAKMPTGTPDYTMMQFMNGQAPQLELMLQALLAERFNLKMHREQKELPVYALTVVKGGPKLKPAAETIAENGGPMFLPKSDDQLQMAVKDLSMQQLCETLSNLTGRPVLDRTGLNGKFDFAMEYESEPDAPRISDLPEGSQLTGPAFFTALQQQVGLKLESTKGPVDVLVIDHAEQPSEN